VRHPQGVALIVVLVIMFAVGASCAAYGEAFSAGSLPGHFTLAVADAADGSVGITSVGEVAGATRRLRVRVVLASPALLAGLFAPSVVRLEQTGSATFILPYGAATADRPWVDLAAGRGRWFATPGVAVNNGKLPPDLAAGPIEPPGVNGSADALPPRPVPGDADLMLGPQYQRVNLPARP